MKRLFTFSILLLAIMTSCTHRAYQAKSMQNYYDLRMDTKEELEIKNQVKIFLSENDVTGDYTILSYNIYKPVTAPIIMPIKGKIHKKFYEKAVKKAYQQGGNAIITTGGMYDGGMYKVIDLHDWDSDNESASKYVNSIFDVSLMNLFNSGTVKNAANHKVKRYVTEFSDEINFNLKCAHTSQEMKIIGDKIEALRRYNNSLAKPQKSITNRLKKIDKIYPTLSAHITKKEAKKNKK